MRLKTTMRVLLRVLILVGVFLFLWRVREIKTSVYEFPNQNIPIDKIELIHNQNPYGQGIDENNFVILKELTESEAASFMRKVYELETKQFGPPPLWGYGSYIARVTYINGDTEMLGSNNITFIEQGNESLGYGEYFFLGSGFEELFKQFVDLPAD